MEAQFAAWKQRTLMANTCFERNQIILALNHYQLAIADAIELLAITHYSKKAVAAALASHHNLAQLYSAKKQHELCKLQLQKAFNLLDERFNRPCSAQQREVLAWGRCKAYGALHIYNKAYPEFGLIDKSSVH
jgi:hypothetical protein